MCATDPRSETDGENAARGALSRRAFLVLSGIATAVGIGGSIGDAPGDTAIPEAPEGILLNRDDLLEEEAYVEWTVDAETAPLARHLDAEVEGFAPRTGAATGFVATANANGPDSIEAGVYPGVGIDAAVAATDEWVQETRDVTLSHEPATGVVQWETIEGSRIDVFRLEQLPSEFLGFVGASGNDVAAFDPQTAVTRHADMMRSRAAKH